MSVPGSFAKYCWSLAMPQPTTNSRPFRMNVLPSADGHMGGEVAGAGPAEDETVAGKLTDARTLET